MAVRTLNLAHFVSVASEVVVLFTVPEGHTAIVKDVRVYNQQPDPQATAVGVRRSGEDVWVFVDLEHPAFVCKGLEGAFIVLQAGDELRGFFAASNITCHVSGALLAGEVES